jgi:hypothetical protein
MENILQFLFIGKKDTINLIKLDLHFFVVGKRAKSRALIGTLRSLVFAVIN